MEQNGSGNRRSARPVKVDKALVLPRATATKSSSYLAKKFGVNPNSRITVSLDRVRASASLCCVVLE
jgi:hypothetical protein